MSEAKAKKLLDVLFRSLSAEPGKLYTQRTVLQVWSVQGDNQRTFDSALSAAKTYGWVHETPLEDLTLTESGFEAARQFSREE